MSWHITGREGAPSSPLGNMTQGIGHPLRAVDSSSIITYGVAPTEDAGNGTVAGDMNATNWTGNPYAQGTCLGIELSHIVTIVHKGASYLYQGPRGVCIGVGGGYTSVAADYSPLGTADHNLLINRASVDAHPTSSITGLDAQQAAQDQALINHTTEADPHPVYLLKDDAEQLYDRRYPGMLLRGAPSNFSLGTGETKLTNYPESAQWDWDDDNDVNPVAGEITIPQTGIYTVTAHVVGTQGNDSKEEQMMLLFDRANGPSPSRVGVDFFDIATDKTSGRCLQATFTQLFTAGEVCSLYMTATSGLGTFNFSLSTFEIIGIADADEIIP